MTPQIPAELRRVMASGVPLVLATCSADGEPNVTVVSQAYYVDPEHVALSFQFFSKTVRNVRENPHAQLCLHDFWTLQRWILGVRYDHSETQGPTFERMNAEIEAIASATGMSGIFRLQAADVYRLTSVEAVPCAP